MIFFAQIILLDRGDNTRGVWKNVAFVSFLPFMAITCFCLYDKTGSRNLLAAQKKRPPCGGLAKPKGEAVVQAVRV